MFTFVGTASERGKQHGSQFAHDIKDRVGRLLSHDLDATQRTRIAQPWLDATEELDTDLVREMAGIAAGSGATLAEIMLLNCFEAFKPRESAEKGGCTVVAASVDRDTVIAQNWDSNPQRAIGLAVHRHRDPDAPDVAVLSSPGGLGWIGMNEYGLALVNNDLVGGPTVPTAPSKVIRRALLRQPDTSAALALAQAISHPALRSYVIADSTGALAAMEVLPYEAPVITNTRATVVHANHAVAPTVRAIEDRSMQESVFPSSAHRARRAAELLADLMQEAGRDQGDHKARLVRVLRDHDGFPGSICRHPDPSEVTHTVASVVFDCAKRRAEFYFGLACDPYADEAVDFGVNAAAPEHTDPNPSSAIS